MAISLKITADTPEAERRFARVLQFPNKDRYLADYLPPRCGPGNQYIDGFPDYWKSRAHCFMRDRSQFTFRDLNLWDNRHGQAEPENIDYKQTHYRRKFTAWTETMGYSATRVGSKGNPYLFTTT